MIAARILTILSIMDLMTVFLKIIFSLTQHHLDFNISHLQAKYKCCLNDSESINSPGDAFSRCCFHHFVQNDVSLFLFEILIRKCICSSSSQFNSL